MSVFHVPNEGMRDAWYTKSLISIGLTPGVLDYVFLVPNEKWHGLVIDMKRINERGRKKRENQEAFIEKCLENGYYATYAYGFDDAIRIYRDYVENRL